LQNLVAGDPCGFVGAWPWIFVFVVDHLPEFGLEGVVGLVDLGLEVGLDGFGEEDS
jgi:hypothetical protein